MPAAPRDMGARSTPDALGVFTIGLAQNLALQVAKDVREYGLHSSAQLVLTAPLAIAVVACHRRPMECTPLLALCAAALLVLAVHGSQSNHVVLEALIAASVLLTAFEPRRTSGRVDGGGDGSNDPVARRAAWSARLGASVRALLGALYAVSGFAKLNDGFFDTSTSCAVLLAAPVLGDRLPASPLVRAAMPTCATAFELFFPLVLLYYHRAASQHARRCRLLLRACVLVGAAFHVLIALPPPPLSVYPFSMLMAPM